MSQFFEIGKGVLSVTVTSNGCSNGLTVLKLRAKIFSQPWFWISSEVDFAGFIHGVENAIPRNYGRFSLVTFMFFTVGSSRTPTHLTHSTQICRGSYSVFGASMMKNPRFFLVASPFWLPSVVFRKQNLLQRWKSGDLGQNPICSMEILPTFAQHLHHPCRCAYTSTMGCIWEWI